MRYAIISNPRDRISSGLGQAGSIAIVSFNLASRLAENHDVVVVAARGHNEAARERIGSRLGLIRISRRHARLHKYRELAATTFEVVPPYFLSPGYHSDFYRRAAQELHDFEPDVIHIQNYGQAAALFRAVCPAARIVVHLHDTSLAHVQTSVAKQILGDADLIVTCSDYVASSVLAAHPWLVAPVIAINNGVDVESFKPGTARAAQSNNLLRLVYVGRLSPEKGVHILIEAFNQVLERAPQARLDLIGGASMFSYAAVKLFRRDPHWAAIFSFYGSNPLQRLFRQLYKPGKRYVAALTSMQSAQAARATRFLGDQPHSAVAAAIACADILVVPSVCDEPFGIPAVEAMAAGVPVVATAAGGLKDIVQPDKTGLLTERSNAAALAAAILELGSDPERRALMGHAARVAAREFTWERAVDNLLKALARVGIATSPTVLGGSNS